MAGTDDWFAMSDDDNSSDDLDGMFGSTSTDTSSDSTYDDMNSGSYDNEPKKNPFARFKDSIGPKKFGLLILIAVGALVLTVVALVFGGNGNKPSSGQTSHEQTSRPAPSQAPQQSQTTTPSTSKNSDWIDVTGANLIAGELQEGKFTVTEVHTYARSTGGQIAGIELRTELKGALDGFDGVYKIIVPYAPETVYTVGTRFTVTYRIGTSDSAKVIYDLTAK